MHVFGDVDADRTPAQYAVTVIDSHRTFKRIVFQTIRVPADSVVLRFTEDFKFRPEALKILWTNHAFHDLFDFFFLFLWNLHHLAMFLPADTGGSNLVVRPEAPQDNSHFAITSNIPYRKLGELKQDMLSLPGQGFTLSGLSGQHQMS
ncbi:MAG: hypothetical protein ACYTE3_02205 [Planctomycetota bacterium]|jgi:hypothetical protein